MQSFNFGYFKKDLNRKSIIKKRRTILNKYIAWQLNKEYYDGKRINGYGGFSYDGRWKKFPVEGNGKSKRNFIFSYDFCNGIHKTLTRGKIGKTYHFSGDEFYKVLDVVKSVCELKFFKLNKLIKKIKGSIGQDIVNKLSSFETRKILDWIPTISIEEGVKNLLGIIHNWKNEPVWTPKSIKKETKTWFKLLDNK